MVEEWIKEIKRDCPPEGLGMILVHNGIVRASSKQGQPVGCMKLSYDREALDGAVRRFKKMEGIADIRTWINEGELTVGDDIMVVCVAGRFRKDILPVFQELITLIKTEIVKEVEW
ncbi:MAG: molybdenum cofactor biosynthesis protein MoaE [Deltaproteobacteria bacterium]|nr:molybdenum cofactor biosynthesis protein MoaE [Deltaproteobacteria bacterium]